MKKKLEDLEKLADDAIARWGDSSLPKLPGSPAIKLTSKNKNPKFLPGLDYQILGFSQGKYVFLIDAHELKTAIAYFREEFLHQSQ